MSTHAFGRFARSRLGFLLLAICSLLGSQSIFAQDFIGTTGRQFPGRTQLHLGFANTDREYESGNAQFGIDRSTLGAGFHHQQTSDLNWGIQAGYTLKSEAGFIKEHRGNGYQLALNGNYDLLEKRGLRLGIGTQLGKTWDAWRFKSDDKKISVDMDMTEILASGYFSYHLFKGLFIGCTSDVILLSDGFIRTDTPDQTGVNDDFERDDRFLLRINLSLESHRYSIRPEIYLIGEKSWTLVGSYWL